MQNVGKSIGRNSILDVSDVMPFGFWRAWPANNTVPAATGIATIVTGGTLTTRAFSTANRIGRQPRLGIVGAATANTLAFARNSIFFATGDGVAGGFLVVYRFGFTGTSSDARMFVGLRGDISAPTNVEPSSLVNSIGVATLSTDQTRFYMICNGTSAGQNVIAVDSAILPPSVGECYELYLHAPNDEPGTVYWNLINAITKVGVSGVFSGDATKVPATTVGMGMMLWRTCNTEAVSASIELCSIITKNGV